MSKDKTYRFTVIVEPCEEGGYFAQCPAFQGCHVEGETYEETMSEMRKTINAKCLYRRLFKGCRIDR